MEKERIEKTVKHSWEMEGLTISAEANAISNDYLDGKISSEQAIKKIKDKYIAEGIIKC